MRTLLAVLLIAAGAAAAEPLVLKNDIEGALTALEKPILAGDAGGGVVGWFGAGVAVWYPALDGEMSDGNERVRFDEVGLDGNEIAIVGLIRLSFVIGVRIDGFTTEFEGEGTLQRDVTFGGVTFTSGTRTRSRLKLSNLRALFTTHIVKTDVLTLALQGGITYFQFDGEVSNSSFGSGQEKGDIPIPIAGALVQVKIKQLLLELDVTGLSVEFGDIEGTVLDVSASVGLTFLEVGWARVGYRIIVVDGRQDAFSIDATLDGFFAAAGVRF